MFTTSTFLASAQTVTNPCDSAPSVEGRVPYDMNNIECRIQTSVADAITKYSSQPQSFFAGVTSSGLNSTDSIYLTVMDATTLNIVAHGADPDRVGQTAQSLNEASMKISDIRAALTQDGHVWIKHMERNPLIGQDQARRTYLQLHGGYIFASGYFLLDSNVQQFVEESVKMYESNGTATFGVITPDKPVTTDELYMFVINASSWIRVADGVVPDRVGQRDRILDTSARSVDDVRSDLQANGTTWATYTFDNPATEVKQLKRTWLYLHDGYVFGSGYYPHASRAQSLVDSAIITYTAHGTDSFAMITPNAADTLSTKSTFVLDSRNMTILAHASLPNLVGTQYVHLEMADRPLSSIMADLSSNKDGVWVWHMARNHATKTDQLTHTYIVLRDTYIFGASYSLPDIRVQAVSDDSIYTYQNNPKTSFELITSGALNRIDIHPVVLNRTHIVAHGTVPRLVGPIPDVQLENTNQRSLNSFKNGESAWTQHSFFNHHTGITQIKRSWFTVYDNYTFAATYTVADADVQSVTDYARFIYDSNRENNAWVDIITPDRPLTTDTLYPFVINASTWTRLADGSVPDRVGLPETILETSGRTVQNVLADLEKNIRTWVTYTFHNPATGVEQLKRTSLQLRDGLVFGSGYYLLDSQVQAVVFDITLKYNANGRTATLATINNVPDEPTSTYVFAVNPQSNATLAQNIDSELIGNVNDWTAITSVLSPQEILDAIGNSTGTWVSYMHTEPITGQLETKRTWLVLHDGIIIGSGYYVSDIPASDVKFVVHNAILTYNANRENNAWVDIITPDKPLTTDTLYPFVIDASTWTRLADGSVPARVGLPERILDTSGRTVQDVLAELREKKSLWVTYTFHNPATGVEQLKRTYLQLHNGLVFGSGYYVLDSRAQSIVNGRILEYERDGRADTISSINTVPRTPISTYAFMVDPNTGTLAQNVDPTRIARSDWDAITSTTPKQDILNKINKGVGTWVSYIHTNPVTRDQEVKYTWLVLRDGLVFGSGYYATDIPATDVKFLVQNTINIYDSNRQNNAWVGIITPDKPLTTNTLYSFVIDASTWTRLADGSVPARVGLPERILDTSGRTVQDVLAELREKKSLWVTYTFHNPATGVEQLKRTYLQLHNGLVFGSGYYILDSRVQSIVNGRILEYERDGRADTISSINRIPQTPISTYAFMVNPNTGTLAQNADPTRIKKSDWDAITSTTSKQDILNKINKGVGTWVSYVHTNPVTRDQEVKYTWLVLRDGLVFGSGYYATDIPATDVKFVVQNTINIYDSNRENNAWVGIITPDTPLTTDTLYPFVINASTWTRLADGSVPARVGLPERILDTSGRTVQDVLAELREKKSLWVTYTFHNPATGIEQLKRTYLQLHNGLVFGSGYYILDSRVQSIVNIYILEYERDGRADTISFINRIPQTPIPTYAFMVDPNTGTLAQNVDPTRITRSDWDAITSTTPKQEILNKINKGVGDWVRYTHTNPVTEEQETKYAWLVLHDGLIFGFGYYESTTSITLNLSRSQPESKLESKPTSQPESQPSYTAELVPAPRSGGGGFSMGPYIIAYDTCTSDQKAIVISVTYGDNLGTSIKANGVSVQGTDITREIDISKYVKRSMPINLYAFEFDSVPGDSLIVTSYDRSGKTSALVADISDQCKGSSVLYLMHGLSASESFEEILNIGHVVQESEAIKSEMEKSETMESETMESETMESETMESETMESETMESEMEKSEMMETKMEKSETMESEAIKSDTMETKTEKSDTMETKMDKSFEFAITSESDCGPGTTFEGGICKVMTNEEQGGGCLIATAAYGTEMAPQIQLLREIRDYTLYRTESGTSFMTGFNHVYYAFSPTISDWERENPAFKHTVSLALTPMISTLGIMSLAEPGSESDVLVYGIGIIALNLTMYIGAPIAAILYVRRHFIHN